MTAEEIGQGAISVIHVLYAMLLLQWTLPLSRWQDLNLLGAPSTGFTSTDLQRAMQCSCIRFGDHQPGQTVSMPTSPGKECCLDPATPYHPCPGTMSLSNPYSAPVALSTSALPSTKAFLLRNAFLASSAFSLKMGAAAMLKIIVALRRNLKVKDWKVSSNMPI